MSDAALPPLIDIPPGHYRHYKGGIYRVLATARHSETLESMTLYQAMHGAHRLWVRPSAMFGEEVVCAGVRQPRFAPVPAPSADGVPVGSATSGRRGT